MELETERHSLAVERVPQRTAFDEREADSALHKVFLGQGETAAFVLAKVLLDHKLQLLAFLGQRAKGLELVVGRGNDRLVLTAV